MRKKKKVELVYYWLAKGNSITSIEAFDKWRVTRLADIVHELRTRYCLPVMTELVQDGRTRFARYRMTSHV